MARLTAVGLLFGVVSPALLPLVVVGVACIVLPLRLFREARRAVRGSRRTRSRGYRDGGLDEVVAGGLLGGVGDGFDGDGSGDGGGGGE